MSNTCIHFPVLHQMQSEIQTFVIGDEGIKRTLRRCWEENKYLLCPHTAVAAAYHYSALDAGSVADISSNGCLVLVSMGVCKVLNWS